MKAEWISWMVKEEGIKDKKMFFMFSWINAITFQFLKILSGCSNSLPTQLNAYFPLYHVIPALDLQGSPVDSQFLALHKSPSLWIRQERSCVSASWGGIVSAKPLELGATQHIVIMFIFLKSSSLTKVTLQGQFSWS